MDRRPDRRRPAVISAGKHTDGQALVLERRGRHRGTVARHVGAHTEDPVLLGLGDDGGVDGRIVGGRDRIPGTFQVAIPKLSEFQSDSVHRLDRRGDTAGNDVHVGTIGHQQR